MLTTCLGVYWYYYTCWLGAQVFLVTVISMLLISKHYYIILHCTIILNCNKCVVVLFVLYYIKVSFCTVLVEVSHGDWNNFSLWSIISSTWSICGLYKLSFLQLIYLYIIYERTNNICYWPFYFKNMWTYILLRSWSCCKECFSSLGY